MHPHQDSSQGHHKGRHKNQRRTATKKTTSEKRSWTILVYLAGDNNLGRAGLVDLKEMKTVGTTDKIAVLAQFDRAGAKKAAIRYCLKKAPPLSKDALKSLGKPTWDIPRFYRTLSPGGPKPMRKISLLYKTLYFAKKSKWDEFLAAYLKTL